MRDFPQINKPKKANILKSCIKFAPKKRNKKETYFVIITVQLHTGKASNAANLVKHLAK